MNFGEALEELKKGQKVARVGWNGKGMFLFLVRGDEISQSMYLNSNIPKDIKYENDFGGDVNPPLKWVDVDDFICMKTAGNTIQPGWLASQSDLLSDDWVIV